jgi:hypothetical protein
MSIAMIGAARVFGRVALYLLAVGPLLMSCALALLIWWHVRRPRRPVLHRALRWGTVAIDAVLLGAAGATVHLAGRFGAMVMAGALALAALLTLAVWKITGCGASRRAPGGWRRAR